MPFGVFAPMPIRLGGSDTQGWTATQHARACADLAALKRSAPIAVFTYTLAAGVITIHAYIGQNGSGTAYAPDVTSSAFTGLAAFTWSARVFEDAYEVVSPLAIKAAKATAHGTTSLRCDVIPTANGVFVRTFDSAGALADGKVTVVLS